MFIIYVLLNMVKKNKCLGTLTDRVLEKDSDRVSITIL